MQAHVSRDATSGKAVAAGSSGAKARRPRRTGCLAALLVLPIILIAACGWAGLRLFGGEASLPQARWRHTATGLNDGRVLVTGGTAAAYNGVFASAAVREVADWPRSRWRTLPPMAMPRAQHTATLLPDGRVLVAGGYARYSEKGLPTDAQSSAEIFDPQTNSWRSVAPMHRDRYEHTATLLRDGRVLIVGGAGKGSAPPPASAEAEIYDPRSDTWTPTAAPGASFVGHAAALLADGRVLVTGGSYRPDSKGDARIYDPQRDSWTMVAPAPRGRERPTLTTLADGRVLAVGGGSTSSDAGVDAVLVTQAAEIYDPASDSWAEAGRLSVGRRDHTATFLPDGRVLVAGSVYGDNWGTAVTELYDPRAGTWQRGPDLGTPRSSQRDVLLADGGVLLIGGVRMSGPLSSVERVRP